MLIVQDAVWNRVSQNRERKIATRYYCDEFHLLLKEKQTAIYSVEIWKRLQISDRHKRPHAIMNTKTRNKKVWKQEDVD